MGVLPVPPTARFPTQMIGKLKDADFKMFLSNSQLRNFIMAPYKKESGKKRYLKLFSTRMYFIARNKYAETVFNAARYLKTVDPVRANAIIQFYIMPANFGNKRFCFKKTKTYFDHIVPALP